MNSYDLVESALAHIQTLEPAFLQASIALVYILAKIVIKAAVRRIAATDYDYRDAISWFGVDLAVLVIGLSISGRVHTSLGTELQTQAWYAFVVLTLVFSILLYGLFVSCWQQKKVWRARFCIAGNLILGYAPFVFVLHLLEKPRP